MDIEAEDSVEDDSSVEEIDDPGKLRDTWMDRYALLRGATTQAPSHTLRSVWGHTVLSDPEPQSREFIFHTLVLC